MDFIGYDIAHSLWMINPSLTTGSEDDQRQFVKMVAEQLVFNTKDERYGIKKAGINRPQGPSQIAYNSTSGLVGWRIIDNDGSVTGVKGGIIPNPPMQIFYGQIFIPVTGINHLSIANELPLPTSDNRLDTVINLLKTINSNFQELIKLVESYK